MKAKHCGECRLFTNEDINGNGWCEIYGMTVRCNMAMNCTNHIKTTKQ